MQVTPPAITSDNALFDEVQSFIRIPKGITYSGDTAEISYQLLRNGVLSDIDTRVGLEPLNDLIVGSGESADGSFYGVVPKNQVLESAYPVINEGITDSLIRLLFDHTH